MKARVALAIVGGLLCAFLFRWCGRKSEVKPLPVPPAPNVHVSSVTEPVAVPVQSLPPVSLPKPSPVKPAPVKTLTKAPPAPLEPPKVQIFKELIPKDIEIVRVYYTAMITGPASAIEFDINGSGFTKEFEKMITVDSGQPDAAVKNLSLVTPNQIHGTLEISPKSATMVAFPHVLIGGKVVFQAPEPFAVIRPGEVLNLIFTEMGESGRTGRFRVFTNLDAESFKDFKVSVSTPAIRISDLAPIYPFIVDGTITIGPAVGGEYDLTVTLKEKTLWYRKGIVRVVRPNLGQSGLIQRTQTVDGFQRPGDKVRFIIQGSGFQPQDAVTLQAAVKDLKATVSSFTYVSPGRMDLAITLPGDAPEKVYELTLSAGTEVLHVVPEAFRIVGKNWCRAVKIEPALKPGGKATVVLLGRDFSPEFVSKLKVEMDEPGLQMAGFAMVDSQQAIAPISASAEVKPGDYLLKITSNGHPVNPEFGSIIRVSAQ